MHFFFLNSLESSQCESKVNERIHCWIGLTCRCSLGWSVRRNCSPSHMVWPWIGHSSLDHSRTLTWYMDVSVPLASLTIQKITLYLCVTSFKILLRNLLLVFSSKLAGCCIRGGFGSGSRIHLFAGCILYMRSFLQGNVQCMKQTYWQRGQ